MIVDDLKKKWKLVLTIFCNDAMCLFSYHLVHCLLSYRKCYLFEFYCWLYTILWLEVYMFDEFYSSKSESEFAY